MTRWAGLCVALAVLVGPASAAAQDVAPAPAQTPAERAVDEGWRLHNGVALAVDDRIMTIIEFFDELDRIRPRATISTAEQQREAVSYLARASVTRLLGQRAGSTLELSELDIDARLRDWIRERREPKGSVAYGAELRREGRDPLYELPRAREELLGRLWFGRETGAEGGAGRKMVDTYVRPGTLRRQYPAWADAQQAEFVELRAVELMGAPVGGPEFARELLAEMRRDILAGEADMAALAAEHSGDPDLRQAQGRIAPLRVANLPDGELRDFVLAGSDGAVSEPIAWGLNGPAGVLDRAVAYRIFRIERKTRAESAPAFESATTQESIRRDITRELASRRETAAAERLNRASMVWMHPMVSSFLRESGQP
jgi:hypothetical protein